MEKLIKIHLSEDIISCYPGDCFTLFINNTINVKPGGASIVMLPVVAQPAQPPTETNNYQFGWTPNQTAKPITFKMPQNRDFKLYWFKMNV